MTRQRMAELWAKGTFGPHGLGSVLLWTVMFLVGLLIAGWLR